MNPALWTVSPVQISVKEDHIRTILQFKIALTKNSNSTRERLTMEAGRSLMDRNRKDMGMRATEESIMRRESKANLSSTLRQIKRLDS